MIIWNRPASLLRGKGLELRSALLHALRSQLLGKQLRALAVSSCLQAALAERSDGSERSEAKQKSPPPYNPLSPTTREVAALRVDLSGAYAPYFLSLVFSSYESWWVNLKICAWFAILATSNFENLWNLNDYSFIQSNFKNPPKIYRLPKASKFSASP